MPDEVHHLLRVGGERQPQFDHMARFGGMNKAILVMLGLPEVPALRRKLQGALSASDRQELIDTVDEIAGKVRQYLGLRHLRA